MGHTLAPPCRPCVAPSVEVTERCAPSREVGPLNPSARSIWAQAAALHACVGSVQDVGLSLVRIPMAGVAQGELARSGWAADWVSKTNYWSMPRKLSMERATCAMRASSAATGAYLGKRLLNLLKQLGRLWVIVL